MRVACFVLFFMVFQNTVALEVEHDSQIDVVETEEAAKSEEKENAAESEQDYNFKLRALEEKIHALKDKIFRSKQRLAILQETVLSGTIAGARVTINHKNEVGGAFQLISTIFYLDEAPVFKKINSPDELNEKEFVVFDASVAPGPHHVSVYYVFKGKGYGFFSYMKGYTFKISAGHSFNIEEGDLAEITVSSKDKGASFKLDSRLFAFFNVAKKMFDIKKDIEKESEYESEEEEKKAE